jgi:hypothetical protein
VEGIRQAPQPETRSQLCSGENGKQPGGRKVRPHVQEEVELALPEQPRGKDQLQTRPCQSDEDVSLRLVERERSVTYGMINKVTATKNVGQLTTLAPTTRVTFAFGRPRRTRMK